MDAPLTRKTSGFTLPEMILAIAFASVLVVSVFGVIGVAQHNVNGSSSKSTQARIAQELVAEILLNDWSSLLEYQDEERYFDPEGNPLKFDSPVGKGDSMWAYRARIEIDEKQANVPGVETNGESESDIPVLSRRVVIQITNGYLPDYDFERGKRHRSFSTWVAKTNKM